MLKRWLDHSFCRIDSLKLLRAIAPTPQGLALVVTLLLTSCANLTAPPNEQVLRDELEAFCSSQNRPVGSFKRIGDRAWQRGVVELYEGVCGAGSAASPLFVEGYQVFERQGWQWRSIGGGSVGMETASPEPTGPISYTIGYAPDDAYVLVQGQIQSPEIATLEAQFDNAITLQDSGDQDRFAIVAAGANRLCELRGLDAQNQVIFRESISDTCETSASG